VRERIRHIILAFFEKKYKFFDKRRFFIKKTEFIAESENAEVVAAAEHEVHSLVFSVTLCYNDKVEGGVINDFTAIEIHNHNSRNRLHNHCGAAAFHRTAKPFQVRGGA
jgi:hypothetical protein